MSEAEHSILFYFMDFLYGMGGMRQICIVEMGQFAPGKKICWMPKSDAFGDENYWLVVTFHAGCQRPTLAARPITWDKVVVTFWLVVWNNLEYVLFLHIIIGNNHPNSLRGWNHQPACVFQFSTIDTRWWFPTDFRMFRGGSTTSQIGWSGWSHWGAHMFQRF